MNCEIFEPIKNSKGLIKMILDVVQKVSKQRTFYIKYRVSVTDRNVSASDLKQIYKFLEDYFYVRKD